MKKVFKSKFTRGGNILRPDVIEITDNYLVYKKRDVNLITVDEKAIPIKEIVEVSIDNHLIGADLILIGRGMGRISVSNFSKGDVRKIKRLIEELK